MKKKLRFPLSVKFSLIFTSVVVLIIVGIAAANQLLLDKTYAKEKRRSLTEAYSVLNEVFAEEDGTESLELEKIYSTENITVLVLDSEGGEVFSSSANVEIFPYKPPFNRGGDFRLRSRNSESNDGQEQGNSREERTEGHREPPSPQKHLIDELSKNLGDEPYVLDEVNDSRLGTGFLQLTARLNNGYYLYLRTPVSSIDEAADIANRQLVYIGFAAIILSLIIIVLVSGAVTKPIRELTDIAADVSLLNFGRRYNRKSRDEIGDLGASINSMSERLEGTVNELRARGDRLESVDRMRKEFIANASHELKTPLAIITGYAEGLRDNVVRESDRAFYCEVIGEEAERMDKIIKQFLTITEIEAAVDGEKTELDFSALVQGIVKSAAILAKQKGVSISLDCDGALLVEGDELALGQAVGNYITNAIHHVDERGIIKAELKRNGEKARFSVFNSGKGIPEAESEKIWQSFYKLDKAHTRSYGGSGLGLAIVKKSVELHGGSCGFRNLDGGVEFFFEIELKAKDSDGHTSYKNKSE